jgi:hypothetical protein
MDFLGSMLPDMFAPDAFPNLARLVERTAGLPAFAETHPKLDS